MIWLSGILSNAGKEEDRMNPYFAPILEENLQNQPDTLVITAEYDPLRDEGEAYGRKLEAAGNRVEIYRIKNALHGFFALGIKSNHVHTSGKRDSEKRKII